jgi:HAD superfamily hydrolase (TIGR01490 family)
MSEDSSPTPGGAAFFDLDRTLLSVNSARLWVESEFRLGRIGRLQLFQAALWLAGYGLGVLDMRRALGKAVSSLEGALEAELERRTVAWFEQEIRSTILKEGRERVAWHRKHGQPVVLLTSSSAYISRCIQAELQLDDFLCSHFEVRDGKFTGRAIEPFCYGPGKVEHAQRWVDKYSISLDNSYFYTDSATDLPMLLAVGHPRVVNPDVRLRREARRRGWTVEDWIQDETRVTLERVSNP